MGRAGRTKPTIFHLPCRRPVVTTANPLNTVGEIPNQQRFGKRKRRYDRLGREEEKDVGGSVRERERGRKKFGARLEQGRRFGTNTARDSALGLTEETKKHKELRRFGKRTHA